MCVCVWACIDCQVFFFFVGKKTQWGKIFQIKQNLKKWLWKLQQRVIGLYAELHSKIYQGKQLELIFWRQKNIVSMPSTIDLGFWNFLILNDQDWFWSIIAFATGVVTFYGLLIDYIPVANIILAGFSDWKSAPKLKKQQKDTVAYHFTCTDSTKNYQKKFFSFN